MTSLIASARCPLVELRDGSKPIRVLQVVSSMDRGGTETWLMHVLRNIDRGRFQFDFLVHTEKPCAYDDEVRHFGSKIYVCRPGNLVQYRRRLTRLLRRHGPYDVVHSHMHHFSGIVLHAAKAAGVPQRIAHSHTDTSAIDSSRSLMRRIYTTLCGHLVHKCATTKLAASTRAAVSLYGEGWHADTATQILHCGIDLEAFRAPVDRPAIRREFQLLPDDFVIGHVGRFVTEKNHPFLLKVYEAVLRNNPRAKLLLVGEGPRQKDIRRLANDKGLLPGIIFAGGRSDVPRLLLGAVDIFVFPSLYEGLGLAAVEAQAAGLPTIVSSDLPDEIDLRCNLLTRMSLKQVPDAWADAIARTSQTSDGKYKSLTAALASHFALSQTLEALRSVYVH